jgi:hypothetical protein
LRESSAYILDEEGLELEGLSAAVKAARAAARSVIASEVLAGKLPLDSIIEIEDETGQLVFELPFKDAVILDG